MKQIRPALRDLKEQPLSLGVAAPELGRKTVRVIDRMIAADPQRRFASYDDLIDELEKARVALDPAARQAKQLPQITVAIALLPLLAGGGRGETQPAARRRSKDALIATSTRPDRAAATTANPLALSADR